MSREESREVGVKAPANEKQSQKKQHAPCDPYPLDRVWNWELQVYNCERDTNDQIGKTLRSCLPNRASNNERYESCQYWKVETNKEISAVNHRMVPRKVCR